MKLSLTVVRYSLTIEFADKATYMAAQAALADGARVQLVQQGEQLTVVVPAEYTPMRLVEGSEP